MARKRILVPLQCRASLPLIVRVKTLVSAAMQAGRPSRAIMEMFHVHKSLPDGLLKAAQALHGQATQLPPDAQAP